MDKKQAIVDKINEMHKRVEKPVSGFGGLALQEFDKDTLIKLIDLMQMWSDKDKADHGEEINRLLKISLQ